MINIIRKNNSNIMIQDLHIGRMFEYNNKLFIKTGEKTLSFDILAEKEYLLIMDTIVSPVKNCEIKYEI